MSMVLAEPSPLCPGTSVLTGWKSLGPRVVGEVSSGTFEVWAVGACSRGLLHDLAVSSLNNSELKT